jgi:hypothetical protein
MFYGQVNATNAWLEHELFTHIQYAQLLTNN